MPSSEMLSRVYLVRTDVSEERSVSNIRVTGIGELGTLAVTSNRRTLRRNTMFSSETSGITRATRHNIPEDGILHIIICLQVTVFMLYYVEAMAEI
jgi:hypothetical protein